MDDHRQIELVVTPDPYVTVRYAGASGDFNPIHIDEEYARAAGLEGRILHGLWTMAQVARAAVQGAEVATPEDGYALKSLSVQFRGMGKLFGDVVVRGAAEADGVVKLDATQGETRLIRNARALIH
ncbi:MAG: hypothetical protein J2O48_07835 [Solirubrobacterales bacterium]|nr:hypothetical protein [Solirubrobacterales bacterium]